MSEQNDGGFAFPVVYPPVDGLTAGGVECYGLSIRDYFAAKAMQVHLNAIGGAKWDSVEECAKTVAGMSYAMADAMLKARG